MTYETNAALLAFLEQMAELADPARYGERFTPPNGKAGYMQHNARLTPSMIKDHVARRQAYTVYPLRGTVVRFGGLDIDDHDGSVGWEQVVGTARKVKAELDALGLKTLIVRSGGGQGVHAWVFWERDQPASHVARLLKSALARAGLAEGTGGLARGQAEVYPRGSNGGALALPFGRASMPLDLAAGEVIDLAQYVPPALAELFNSDIDPALLPAEPKPRRSPARRVHQKLSLAQAGQLLNKIPADDYDTWIKVGMIVMSVWGDDAFDAWVSWSQTSEHFQSVKDCQAKWATFDEDGPLTLGSLFFLARENGWEPDHSTEIAEMNERFGILTRGNKTLIIEKNPEFDRENPIQFLAVGVFKDRVRAEQTFLGKSNSDKDSKGPAWMAQADASHYHAIDFNPAAPPGDNGRWWNIWRGFAVQPKPGDWSLFRAFVRDVIAGGDEHAFGWLINWMALGVQKPADVIGTAPVLRGLPGTGKGFFVRAYAKLWGAHAVTVTHPDHVTGKFNTFLLGRRLVFVDEGVFGGDRARAGVLKTRLTEPTIMVEPKGIDSFMVKNRMIFIIASNEESVIPADLGDRRWQMLEVSDCRKEDHVYFAAIDHQMANGGYEAMLHDLLQLDLATGPNPTRTTPNKALFTQFIRTAAPELRFLHGILDRGMLPGSPLDEPETTTIAALWAACRQGEPGARYLSDAALAKKVRDLLGAKSLGQTGIWSDHPLGPFKRTTRYRLPPLAEARRIFSSGMGLEIAWSEAGEWVAEMPPDELADSPPKEG